MNLKKTFYYCDRCGEKIEHSYGSGGTLLGLSSVSIFRGPTYELCDKCNNEFVKWFRKEE